MTVARPRSTAFNVGLSTIRGKPGSTTHMPTPTFSPFIYYKKAQQTSMNDYGRAVENTDLHMNNNNKNTKKL